MTRSVPAGARMCGGSAAVVPVTVCLHTGDTRPDRVTAARSAGPGTMAHQARCSSRKRSDQGGVSGDDVGVGGVAAGPLWAP